LEEDNFPGLEYCILNIMLTICFGI